MRLSRAEAKRIALARVDRRAAVREVGDRAPPRAPAERMGRRRLKAFHALSGEIVAPHSNPG